MVHQRTDVRTPKWRVIFLCHSHKMQQHHSEKLSASYVPNVLWVISREKKQAKDKKIPQTCCQLLPASSHLPFLDHLFHWISFPHHHLRGLVELFVRRTVYLLVHSSTFIVCKKNANSRNYMATHKLTVCSKEKKKQKKAYKVAILEYKKMELTGLGAVFTMSLPLWCSISSVHAAIALFRVSIPCSCTSGIFD